MPHTTPVGSEILQFATEGMSGGECSLSQAVIQILSHTLTTGVPAKFGVNFLRQISCYQILLGLEVLGQYVLESLEHKTGHCIGAEC